MANIYITVHYDTSIYSDLQSDDVVLQNGTKTKIDTQSPSTLVVEYVDPNTISGNYAWQSGEFFTARQYTFFIDKSTNNAVFQPVGTGVQVKYTPQP